LWLMPRVGNPLPSPDGKWVVFSIAKPAYDEKESSSDLWLVPSDRSAEPRQITFTKSAESDVAWSPDSRRIAFSAKREGDEQNQIYILDLGGGEARRVTHLSTGARSPQFRPDGGAILFTSVVYPEARSDEDNKRIAKEHKDRKYHVRAYSGFPIRHWDRWLDGMQAHVFVQGLAEETAAHDLLAGTKLVSEPGFGGRTAEGSREEIDAEWAPDGQSIVFAVSTNRNTAAYAETSLDLYRIAVQGGAVPELIARDNGSYVRPRFSPDGKTLYAVFEPNVGKVYSMPRLARFDWPSMQNRKILTGPPFDRAVAAYAVAPDSQTIYFTAEEAGLEKIFRVSAGGGDAQLAVDPKRGVYSRLMIAEKAPSLVMTGMWGSSTNPAEVVRIDPEKKSHANLTEINVVTANNIDWLPPEHFWFTSKRGKKIHSMIIRPPAFDATKKYPLLVEIHGGPASMSRDDISLRWNYHLLAKPGYVVLTTNYTGSTGFGEKFAQDIQGDPLKGPGDEINEAADEAIKRFPFIDGTRQAAAGASYGGHLANWMEASTTRYKCLIAHAGLVNLETQYATSDGIYYRELMNLGPPWEQGKVWREQNPIRYAARFKTPILVSVGERDMRVPANNSIENWSVLQRMKVPSRFLVWPDENHWILNPENSRYWYGEVWDWLG
ncbi:MAG TPA: S9 family peptidase, partial [Thermoanaerobaculia bacterium]|nr:S9 family peptidase [Thermoanaerobaculia bacterium]